MTAGGALTLPPHVSVRQNAMSPSRPHFYTASGGGLVKSDAAHLQRRIARASGLTWMGPPGGARMGWLGHDPFEQNQKVVI